MSKYEKPTCNLVEIMSLNSILLVSGESLDIGGGGGGGIVITPGV